MIVYFSLIAKNRMATLVNFSKLQIKQCFIINKCLQNRANSVRCRICRKTDTSNNFYMQDIYKNMDDS